MVLLLMTSVGERRLSRKPDFKGANEKKDGKQAGTTCQNREWAEDMCGRGILRFGISGDT